MAAVIEPRLSEIFEAFGMDGFQDRREVLYFSNQDLTEWGRYGYFGTMWAGHEFTTYMGFGGVRMYLTRPPRSNRPSDGMVRLLIHEAVHVIQHALLEGNTRGVPTWLMEGTAVYFEGRPRSGFDDILAMGVRDNNIRTLSYLEEIDWDSDSFAWDVWGAGMVRFIHEVYGFEYVGELHRNYDIEAVFGISRDEFQRQWHQWVRDNFR